MRHTSPFDHRPDPVLGAALRAALTTEDDAAFADRVVAAAEADLGTGLWWQELTALARPGLVAALLVVAAVGFWMGALVQGRGAPANGTAAVDDPFATVDSTLLVPALLAGEQAPEVDLVLGLALER